MPNRIIHPRRPLWRLSTLLLAAGLFHGHASATGGGGGHHPPIGCWPMAQHCTQLGHIHFLCPERKPVIPKMQHCVDNGDGTYTATWGYLNRNDHAVYLPISPDNRMKGPGVTPDMGQPTTLAPGKNPQAFTTTFSGHGIRWILDGKRSGVRRHQCLPQCQFDEEILSETWDTFDTTRWEGDGDQLVENGYFKAQPSASSAFATYKTDPVPVEPGAVLTIRQKVRLLYPDTTAFAQSGLLFLADLDGSFTNFAFVDIGYSTDQKLYVEILGADGPENFDQFEESELGSAADQTITVELRITRDSYSVFINGAEVNTVALDEPITQIALLEFGVQRGGGGLEGQLDEIEIFKSCDDSDPCD